MKPPLPQCKHRSDIGIEGQFYCGSGKIIGTPGVVKETTCLRLHNGEWKPCPYVNSEKEIETGVPEVKQNTGERPGQELKRLIARLGFKGSAGCKCSSHTKQMDENGADWCEENIELIVGWLRDSAKKQGIPFVSFVARKIVKMAVKRSRKNKVKKK